MLLEPIYEGRASRLDRVDLDLDLLGPRRHPESESEERHSQ